MAPKRLAIFASGGGSNAEAIMRYFQDDEACEVALLICNKSQAGVLDKAITYQIPVAHIDRKSFYESTSLLEVLADNKIDFIALAGFLWLVPPYLVSAYRGRMVNIHPALLPAYGGKGMYGHHIHEAVIAAKEQYSGLTIHWVSETYDEGTMILQVSLKVQADWSSETLARQILRLEHLYYPMTIAQLMKQELATQPLAAS